MTAGLPGTGIGGIFYLLMAVAMPLRELYYKFRGNNKRSPWTLIMIELGLVLGIIGGIWAEVALLNYALQYIEGLFAVNLELTQVGMGSQLDVERAKTITFLSAISGFITLGLVYGFVRLVQGILWVRRNVVIEVRGRPFPVSELSLSQITLGWLE
jgi:hypothetical protein